MKVEIEGMGKTEKIEQKSDQAGGISPALKPKTGMQVGDFKKSSGLNRPGFSKAKSVFIVVVLIVAVLAGYMFVSGRSRDTTTYQKPKTPAQQAIDVVNAYSAGKGDKASLTAAQKQLSDLETSAKASSDKQIYAQTAVELYMQANDLDAALTKALNAEGTYHTAVTAASVAGIYRQQANKPKAAEYYQLAMDRSPKSTDPTERSAYNDYRIMKSELESQ